MSARTLHPLMALVFAAAVFTGQAPGDGRQTEELRARYLTAQKFETAGDWGAAEREWREVVRLAPRDARAWVNLGVVLNRQNKPGEAIDAWSRAASIDPRLAGAHFNAGLAHVRNGD
ncbi:MAG: tetratricopeptide repeat protein, partial [Pyrinomonadaceae bacterium]